MCDSHQPLNGADSDPHLAHDPSRYGPEDAFCSDCEAWQYDQIVTPNFLNGLSRIQARGQ